VGVAPKPSIVPTVLQACGLAALAVGFGMAWLPLGFIAGGLALVAFATLMELS
jgi:hypothetical protein